MISGVIFVVVASVEGWMLWRGIVKKIQFGATGMNFTTIQTAFNEYFSSKGSYPPGYGYWVTSDSMGNPIWWQEPYMVVIGFQRAKKLRDYFSAGYDTNSDQKLSRLEYYPESATIPELSGASAPYSGGRPVDSIHASGWRPYVYLPYNRRDLNRIQQAIKSTDDSALRLQRQLGQHWGPDLFRPNIEGEKNPPVEYDAFVLISVGPMRNTRGIVVPPQGEDSWLAEAGVKPQEAYYALALRAVYLATRDLSENGPHDFGYFMRDAKGEGISYPLMPDGKDGPGAPIIFVSQ